MYFRSAVIVVFCIGLLAGCGSTNFNQALTLAPGETLTSNHADEVKAMIESYYMRSGSLETLHNPSQLAQVAMGPLLETLSQFSPPESGQTLYVTRTVSITQVHVLEYTSSNVKAIGCGRLEQDEVTYEGEYIRSSNPFTLVNIFAFVREDGTWKLFTMYGFGDTKSAIRDWDYVSDEEKQVLGDLNSTIDLYWSSCVEAASHPN